MRHCRGRVPLQLLLQLKRAIKAPLCPESAIHLSNHGMTEKLAIGDGVFGRNSFLARGCVADLIWTEGRHTEVREATSPSKNRTHDEETGDIWIRSRVLRTD